MSNAIQELVWNSVFGEKSWKAVASRMADHADEDGCGIWPSIERLAAQTELSERTVQRALSGMVDAGILVIVAEGGKGRFSTTRYDFDIDRLMALPEAEWASKSDKQRRRPKPSQAPVKGDTVTPLSPAKGDRVSAKGDTVSSLGCHGDTQTTIEPPIEPPSSGARARDAAGKGDEREGDSRTSEEPTAEGLTKRAEALFFASFKHYDRFDVSPKKPMLTAWEKLTWAEMNECAPCVPLFIARCRAEKVNHAPAISTFLDERLWKPFVDEAARAATAKAEQPIHLKPYGKGWMGRRFDELERQEREGRASFAPNGFQQRMIDDGKGHLIEPDRLRAEFPTVRAMDDAAGNGSGVLLPAGTPIREHDDYVAIEIGSEEWQAWEKWHRERDWPWISPPSHFRFVWVPVSNPLTAARGSAAGLREGAPVGAAASSAAGEKIAKQENG